MSKFIELKDIVICDYCDCVFDCPVILPCSEIICEKHVEEMKFANNFDDTLKCNFCGEQHLIPKDGFIKDKRLSKMIELEYHQMDFGKAHRNAHYLCKELNQMIGKYEILTKEPEFLIEDYFQKIFNQINLRREESHQVTEKWYNDCIQEIESYKIECLVKLDNESPKEFKLIDGFRRDLQVWQKKLLIPELSKNEFSFEKIEKNVRSSVQVLSSKIDDYKDNLLNGNEYNFQFNQFILPEIFGQIKVEKKVKF